MPTRSDVVAERLEDLGQDLTQLWKALTRDPKKQAWSERVWKALSKASTVAATMAARRMAGKTWRVLTGETPPAARK
jgi:hypothetical protein